MSKKITRSHGLGCLYLFALPFASVGVFMAYLTVSTLVEWWSMRSWLPVDAHIVSVDLESHRGSDSTTFEVAASYRYVFEGRELRGSRVSLHQGADNLGDYHHEVYRELSRLRGQSVPAFVDPDDPTASVLYRDLRLGLIGFYLVFVVVFGGAGTGMMAAGVYGSRKAKRRAELEALHPDEPWLQREEWQDGRIRSSSKTAFLTTAGFALLWNLISMPVVVLAHDQILDPENRIALVALLFPLVGAGLLWWAAKSFARYRRFGESIFEMSTVPGVIGGPLAGTIRMRMDVLPRGGFRVKLSSIRRTRSGSGKNRSTSERVLWQKSHRVTFDRSMSGVPISFHVPFDCEPTDESDSDDRKLWRLEVDADVPGVDYHAQFEVPLFRTEHSSDLPGPEEPEPAGRIDVPLAARLRDAGARVEHLPAGKRYVFPMGRQAGTALGLTAFFVVWTAVVVGLWYSDAPRLFPWVFAGFDVLLLFGVLDLWFHASRIEVRPGQLSVAAGLFGGGAESFSSGDVESVATKRGMQSGNKLYYQLEVRSRDGKSHTAAKRLPDLDTAEQLAREIEAVLRT